MILAAVTASIKIVANCRWHIQQVLGWYLLHFLSYLTGATVLNAFNFRGIFQSLTARVEYVFFNLKAASPYLEMTETNLVRITVSGLKGKLEYINVYRNAGTVFWSLVFLGY
jgi:hypothetical protein